MSQYSSRNASIDRPGTGISHFYASSAWTGDWSGSFTSFESELVRFVASAVSEEDNKVPICNTGRSKPWGNHHKYVQSNKLN